VSNNNYYLYNSSIPEWWTMSPEGFNNNRSYVWLIYGGSEFYTNVDVSFPGFIRTVLNIKSNTTASGTGTSSDPFVVE